MARAVVTGAAGFLGSHLCERLLDEGWDVVAFDSLITGDASNLEDALRNPRFSFENYNVVNHIYVAGDVDWVLHFASPASPIDYLELPIQTLKVGALGTFRTLGLAKAKGAGFMLASTSEVYGDPKIHPQPESYWGNVNPVGPRGVYDEAKRYAEAMAMAYHRVHDIPVKITRIFNSVLADQQVVLFNDDAMHVEPVGDYASSVALDPDRPRRVLVPAFDPSTLRMELKPASALIRHPAVSDAYELRMRYGRSVKVTGDHSVFVRDGHGNPQDRPVRDLRVGDYVAIPGRLPVVEVDRTHVSMAKEIASLSEDDELLWKWKLRHPALREVIAQRRGELGEMLLRSGRYAPTRNLRHTVGGTLRKWLKRGELPLYVARQLGLEIHEGTELGLAGSSRWIPESIELTDEILWLLGFYLAEGSEHAGDGRYFISMCSNEHYLHHAAGILELSFGVRTNVMPPTATRGPTLIAHSRALHLLFTKILGLRERRIPPWVMQLPPSRLKFFLEGFRCGDGTHSGKKMGSELCFDTTSEQLAIDLSYLLLRFGIVASFGRYETTFRRRYGDRRFPFFRLTVCEVDDFNILNWDTGVVQTLNARRSGDLVWSQLKELRPCVVTGHVYDFSVPGSENFVAGNGVCCHNTFGPRMRRADGRAVPTFIRQALEGEPVTVHGDGSQTRSLCYVDDLIEGIYRFLTSDVRGPMNLGNAQEVTIKQLAELIADIAGSGSGLQFEERPLDDPEMRCPDISLAMDKLGWTPQVELEEGLRRTIEWARLAWAED